MPDHPRTTVRSHRVAVELRRFREAAGLSRQEVAARLGMSTSRITRLEAGACGLRILDVEALLGLYEVPSERRAAVLAVVRQAHQRIWWAQRSEAPRHWRSLCHLESAANRLRDFQLHLVPALLRTPDYGRQLLADDLVRRPAAEVDNLVALQIARQALLARPDGPFLHAIVDEHALVRLHSDDPVSRGQLRHLVDSSEQPNVTLQVIPNSVGLHAGMHGSFTIMEYDRDIDVVCTETLVSAAYFQTASSVRVYRNITTSLLSVALSPRQSRDFLHELTTG
jgi:transcriptional regulator with XRE-family HTH domain